MQRSTILFLLTLVSIISCTKIENLNSETSLESFTIVTHSPESIIIGEASITSDTVYIPIKYGKYNFPLTIRAKASGSYGTYIYGLDEDDDITFDSIDAEAYRFVVSAENGKSKNYYIIPLEAALDESTELFDYISFDESDTSELMLSDILISGTDSNEKSLIAFDAKYPITVTPLFYVAESSTIESYRESEDDEWLLFANGGTPITFYDKNSYIELNIVSESGKESAWRIDSEIIEFTEINSSIQIDYKEIEATLSQQGLTVNRYDINFDTREITIVIEESETTDVSFPLDISLDIPVSQWLTITAAPNPIVYSFNSWDDTFSFALLYEEKLQATLWSIGIEQYEPTPEPITIESSRIGNFTCGTYTFILTFNHLTLSSTKTEPTVYESSNEIHIYYSSYYEPVLSSTSIPDWWAELELNLTLSNDENISHTATWQAELNSSNKITQTEIREALGSTQYIDIIQPDGSAIQWAIKLIKDDVAASSECELLGITINNTQPSYLSFKEPPYTIDESASMIYLNIGEYYNFPMQIDITCDISQYASLKSGNNLAFNTESDTESIIIEAQDGVSYKGYTVKLIVPQSTVAPDISYISFGTLTSGASIQGEPVIDIENHTITIGMEATDALFPLSIPISDIEITEDGIFDMPSSGSLVFSSAQNSATAWVSSSDGSARQLWNFKIFYYQQISGGDMNSWEWNASPITSSLPWSTPNMSGIAYVENTTPVTGYSGSSGDYAAKMTTGTSWGQLASGSIFTGWFDKDNSTALGLSDPVRLTYFGTPFTPDAKIKGVSADISYAQATGSVDWGSLTVTLIDGSSTQAFEFHGNKPNDYSDPTQGSSPHPNNTALEVAAAKMIFGNGSASTTTYGDKIDMNVTEGEWTQVYIPISTNSTFTHISIAAASSAYGDYFIGVSGSTMRIDNVKIIYE